MKNESTLNGAARWIRRGSKLAFISAAVATGLVTSSATPSDAFDGGDDWGDDYGGWGGADPQDFGVEEPEPEPYGQEQKSGYEERSDAERATAQETTVSFDAFGTEYSSADAARSADVVYAAQASIANAEITGTTSEYVSPAPAGVYRHGTTNVVLGTPTDDGIAIRPDDRGNTYAHIGKNLDPQTGDNLHLIPGDPTDELLVVGNGSVVLDFILGSENPATPETIVGNSGKDFILSYGGNDTVYGLEGHDRIFGGDGNDKLVGGPGDDQLHAEGGDDILLSGPGNDTSYGGRGNDIHDGGSGNDYIADNTGDDTLNGGPGNDILTSGSGQDILNGGLGDDTNIGGAGADRIIDTKGDSDTVYAAGDYVNPDNTDTIVLNQRSVDIPQNISVVDGKKFGTPNPEFVERVSTDLAMLQAIPEGQRLLVSIANGKHPVVIGRKHLPHVASTAQPLLTAGQTEKDAVLATDGAPGSGTGAYIDLATTGLSAGEFNLVYPIPAGLETAHELLHARDYVTGRIPLGESIEFDQMGNPRVSPTTGGPVSTAIRELSVVGPGTYDWYSLPKGFETSDRPVTENSIRRDLNLPPRNGYRYLGAINGKGQKSKASAEQEEPSHYIKGIIRDFDVFNGSEVSDSSEVDTIISGDSQIGLDRQGNSKSSGGAAECVDSDGDDWGWTGTSSCRMPGF